MKGLFHWWQKMGEIFKIGEISTDNEDFLKQMLETLENKGFLYEVFRKYTHKHFDVVIYTTK